MAIPKEMQEKYDDKYILIGIPNCGKTTLGRRAAEILQIPFFDTDDLTVKSLNLENPSDMFRSSFNAKFLKGQYEVMNKIADEKGSAIIATGAEAALAPECAELMQKMGTVIYIQRKLEIVLAEYKNSGKRGIVMRETTRGTEIDMQEDAMKLYAKECIQYEALANLTLENNGSEDEGLEKLIALIKGL